jgi:iron complex transport system substrate-binding protein
MSLSPNDSALPPPRRVVPLTLVITIAILVACVTAGGTAAYLELRPASTGHSGVTVTDDVGRTVTVPTDPSRSIVLGPSVMDTMYRLGLRNHVVGVDCSNSSLGGIEGDYTPAQVSLWTLTPSMCVLTYPQVRTADLLDLNPQVVLASTVVSVPGLEQWSTSTGIPVVFFGPSTLGSVVYDVQMVATVFAVGTPAEHLVGQVQAALDRSTSFLNNLTNNGTPLRSVLMSYYPIAASEPNAGYYTFGPGTFGQSLIELAGGVNIAGNAPTSVPELSGTQVLSDNPSYVIYGTGFGIDLAQYQQGPDWTSIPAVNHGNLSGVDVTIMTEVDPTMVLALPMFGQLLYPGAPGA